MPIYEYECVACGEKFEKRRSFTDSDKDLKCPRCGAENPRRAISAFATGSSSSGSGSSFGSSYSSCSSGST